MPEPQPAPEPWCGDDPCPCEEGTESKHYQTETLSKCKLAANATVQGYPCKGGFFINFHKDGILSSCVFTGVAQVGAHSCRDKIVYFFPDGVLKQCYLAETIELAGLPCRDGTSFNRDGSPHRCRLEEAVEFQGFSLPAGDWITLDEGKLYRWEMRAPQSLGDLKCKGGYNYFHSDGTLAKCRLAAPATLDGQEIEADTDVCFDTEGQEADCSSMSFRKV